MGFGGVPDIVDKTSTQTLSGKTLVSPTITTSPTAAGATWADMGTVTTIDINGGTVDGAVIGGAATAAASVTTLNASGAALFTAGDVKIRGAGITAAASQLALDQSGAATSRITAYGTNGSTDGNFSFNTTRSDGTNFVEQLKLSGTAGASQIVNGIRIGADSTNNLLDDASTGAGTATLYIGNGAITVTSDMRLKKNVETTTVDAVSTLGQLRVVDYDWDDPSESGNPLHNKASRGRWTGMLAQEMVGAVPFIVNAPDRECTICIAGESCAEHPSMWQVDLDHMAGLFVKAIQQIDARLVAAGL